MANDTDSLGFYAGEVLERTAARQPDNAVDDVKSARPAAHPFGDFELLFPAAELAGPRGVAHGPLAVVLTGRKQQEAQSSALHRSHAATWAATSRPHGAGISPSKYADRISRSGHKCITLSQRLLETLPCAETFFYRNKMESTFGELRWLLPGELGVASREAEPFALGLHVPGRYDRILHIDAERRRLGLGLVDIE